MHTRSAKSKETGLFTVIVWDWNGRQVFQGDFATIQEADAAAAAQERAVTLRGLTPEDLQPLTLAELLMSDDELLRELSR